eukprot:TRINITY_DN51117_c0_g1_i1.p3 TRINITY_DN51117_c0_g1~~TRINITY_DN51117_c0_g1_i1.p3  ORF type:complete len:108 (+),score=23.22 TRINITY_DN51117_c0_g1_i1:78-401(+)
MASAAVAEGAMRSGPLQESFREQFLRFLEHGHIGQPSASTASPATAAAALSAERADEDAPRSNTKKSQASGRTKGRKAQMLPVLGARRWRRRVLMLRRPPASPVLQR